MTCRGMLEAVYGGKKLTSKALRRLKVNSVTEYAKAVASHLNGEFIERFKLITVLMYNYVCLYTRLLNRTLEAMQPGHGANYVIHTIILFGVCF